MICSYKKCNKEFEPRTHNMKYCSDECCRIATNIKIKEKYYERKERLNGNKRICSNKNCKNSLSRYNESKICTICEQAIVIAERNYLLDLVKNVSS